MVSGYYHSCDFTIIGERGDIMPDDISGAGFIELDTDDDIIVDYDAIDTDIRTFGNDIVSANGDISLVTDNENIIQAAINNMRTIYNELLIDPERGNMIYYRRLKSGNNDLRQVEYDCKSAIMIDDRIQDVPYIRATKYGRTSCMIDFQITKHDGEIIDGNTLVPLN